MAKLRSSIFIPLLLLASLAWGQGQGTGGGQGTSGPQGPTTAAGVVALFTGCSGTQYLGADGACHNAVGGSGTVTSVTYTGDGIFDSSTPSAAVTTSGTLTATVIQQAANCVFAGPASGGNANPSCRALVALDLPSTAVQTGQTNVYGAFLQDFTSGTMEIPEAAGFTAGVNSTIGLDTNSPFLVHLWSAGADGLAATTTSTTTTTTQALFATAVAGIYNPRAIAAGDVPAALSSTTSVNGTTIPSSVTLAYLGAAAQTFTNNLTAPVLVSNVAAGTPPLTVTSPTNVPNLNASSLNGATFAAPGTIGGGTASPGNFTNVIAQTHLPLAALGIFNPAALPVTTSRASLASLPALATDAQGQIIPQYGQGAISAASAAINTTETIVIKSAMPMPANRFAAGSIIHIYLWGTTTDTVANTSTFKVKVGTTGATGDTTVATVTTGASGTTGTNAAFEFDILLTIRSVGSGTNATADGRTLIFSAANGIQGGSSITVPATTMAGFDSTLANEYISVSYVSAATTTTSTFQQGYIAILN